MFRPKGQDLKQQTFQQWKKRSPEYTVRPMMALWIPVERNQMMESPSPMLVEVICERAHCVIYEYAIVTVKFVADEFKGRIKVKPVVRRGSRKNVDRYLELCRINGQLLSVPAILMGGKLVFTYVPGVEDMRRAMEDGLAEWEKHLQSESAFP
jgi:hypothetical protein